MALIRMSRHLNVRRHSTIDVNVPDAMLNDPTYFDEAGQPTAAFDQYACDNGEEYAIAHEPIDDDQLSYVIEEQD